MYSLVYETLNLLSEQKKKVVSSVDKEGNDKDINFDNDNEDFLPLDDVIEEGNDINLHEDINTFNKRFSVYLNI